jgi:hypothetical protein
MKKLAMASFDILGRHLPASTRCAQRFKGIVASIVGLLLQPVNPRQLLGVACQRASFLTDPGIDRPDGLTQF